MGGSLTFGTAGIRGEVGPGSNRMNRAVVIRTSRGLADHLLTREGGPPSAPVVLGFDARPSSRGFAEDAAGVLAAAGIEVMFFPEVTPTPLVAFAAKLIGAPAAVVVTASHNPPADNGYKVYGSNAAQIIPPEDTEIASAIDRVGPASGVPRIEGGVRWRLEPGELGLRRTYTSTTGAKSPRPGPTLAPRTATIVYTPLHGVGGKILNRLCAQANHSGLVTVPEQAAPDGKFPTVSFPNPEEPGALDLALSLAGELDARLVIANDPDADRLAAAVPIPGGWRLLSGNEIGVLLGDYVLRYWKYAERPIVVDSIVSSPMLGVIAGAARGPARVHPDRVQMDHQRRPGPGRKRRGSVRLRIRRGPRLLRGSNGAGQGRDVGGARALRPVCRGGCPGEIDTRSAPRPVGRGGALGQRPVFAAPFGARGAAGDRAGGGASRLLPSSQGGRSSRSSASRTTGWGRSSDRCGSVPRT